MLDDLPHKPVLINAIGADAPGKQELDHAILKDAYIVVDDIDQALYSGEINTAITKHIVHKKDINLTLLMLL